MHTRVYLGTDFSGHQPGPDHGSLEDEEEAGQMPRPAFPHSLLGQNRPRSAHTVSLVDPVPTGGK